MRGGPIASPRVCRLKKFLGIPTILMATDWSLSDTWAASQDYFEMSASGVCRLTHFTRASHAHRLLAVRRHHVPSL